MILLISPNSPVMWNRLSASITIPAATDHATDLACLDWEPSEQTLTPQLLELALRRGHACSTGIVVHGGDVAVLDHPDRIRNAYETARAAHEALQPHRDELEKTFPGTVKRDREQTRSIADVNEQAMKEATAEADQLLAGDRDPDLVQHWESLGGRVPEAW